MATKTFKIGEYCKGGIITVEVNKGNVVLIGKDWDTSAGWTRSSNQSNAKEWTRETVSIENWPDNSWNWLSDMTSAYYAEMIMKWINTKVPEKYRKDERFLCGNYTTW